MGMDAGDLVDNLLDEQARRNAAINDMDIDTLITDWQQISPVELVGFQTATLTTTGYAAPHHWGDGQSFWGFVSWGN